MSTLINIEYPPICGAYHPETGEAILLMAGQTGYFEWPDDVARTPKEYNEYQGIGNNMINAMMNGSMFGWHTLAADPDNPINDMPLPWEAAQQ